MKHLINVSRKAVWAACLVAVPFVAQNTYASDTDNDNPLRFYKGENNSYLQATLEGDMAVFSQGNAWFGKSESVLGEVSKSWFESLVRPGIEGSLTLRNSQKIYGRMDAVQANSSSEIDADGTNRGLGAVSYFSIENAYAGWRSGSLFSSLGEDFFDISFGRQSYLAGTGFLFASQGGAGFKRAAWYLGGRRSADYAALIRMKTGGWSGDLVYFKADDIADSDTKAGGATMDYTFEKLGTIGGGIYTVSTGDPLRPERDSMNVYDIRGSVKPFEMRTGLSALKPLKFEAEYAYEDKTNDFAAGNGWYIAASYQFEQIPWKPILTYRYTSFNENFDPLFYGLTDWGSWYQGEIIGEYVLANTNLDSNMIKLKVQPVEPLAVNLIYYRFALHDPAAFTRNNSTVSPVTSDAYADEFDVIFDWTVNTHLTLSLVGAYALPGAAEKQHIGGTDNWSYMMLAGSLKF